jgi:polyferredoxin
MLADLILVLHAAFVLLVVGGLAAIWIGFAIGRRWCANVVPRPALSCHRFRGRRVAAGAPCPLTVWEDTLRGSGAETGFVQRWVSAILYWTAPGWVFTVLYVAFGALVVWAWIRVPPRRKQGSRNDER